MLRRTMLAGLASLALIGGCSSSGRSSARIPAGPGQRDIADAVARNPDFSDLARLIRYADYTDLLQRRGPITLFAPTDKAFAKLRPGQRGLLLQTEDRDLLRAILDRHIVARRVPFGQGTVVGPDAIQQSVRTIDGTEVPIVGYGRQLRFGTANVTRANIPASNGLIHAIDQVQLPPKVFQGPGSFLSSI